MRHFGGDMMRGKARKENEGPQSSDRDSNDRHLQNNKRYAGADLGNLPGGRGLKCSFGFQI